MPKKFIRRFLPDHEKIRAHKRLQLFGRRLHDPNLWHLNRRSAAGAFAVGLFMAFMPVPFQMLLAAGAAIIARVNLAVSVALVWITNPVTMPPIFYFAYRTGTRVMGVEPTTFRFSGEWLTTELSAVWAPLLLGCFVLATLSSLLGYTIIRGLWRLQLVQHARRKKVARSQRGS